VTLLGQNVNSYRYEDTDFAGLMLQVAGIDGIERVRFTSPHPKAFPQRLLEAVASNDRLCSHIHLPLQAGSTRVLKKMNRGYSRDEFLRLVDLIRATIPNVSLTTDIICGFPTETDADFAETEEVMRAVEFDSAFIFKYSERQGTIAAKLWEDDLPDGVKSERVTRLVAVQREISLKRHQAMIGRTARVLIEGESRKNSAEWKARTDGNMIVVFADPHHQISDFCDVRITEATPNTLLGIAN
jgi:tRNA-2-methylthio-N6-dimethylallyladenosine synthase